MLQGASVSVAVYQPGWRQSSSIVVVLERYLHYGNDGGKSEQ